MLPNDASLASLPSKFDDVPDQRARLHPVRADITDPVSVSAAISSWIDGDGGDGAADKGKRRLDVLVNNAGISDLMHPTGECPMAMWDRQILVNMTGSFVTSQHAIQQFLKQEPVDGQRGVILNVISAAGVHGARAGEFHLSESHSKSHLISSHIISLQSLVMCPKGRGEESIS